ncbi:periphilin-1-like [Arvicanthis niloticus]|uniref:periphilin-1-like n=1 Tax=Arvicanthis niloticus TaxID=61156 RepID=UPI001486424F|nr:periphilin-1-like [Arvicanthis niloticus]XP_034341067.1 periphilin-1-like [Arvicanthis niloticus]
MDHSAIGYYCRDQYWEAATAVAAQQWNIVAYTRAEVWSERQYDYERLPRERVPPRSHPSYGYHRVVNIVPRRPPLLDKILPVMDKTPTVLDKTPTVLDKTPTVLERTPSILDNRPPILDNRPPILDNRPPILDNRPPILDNRPPILDNRPPILDNRPPILDNRPPILDNRPPILDNRPPVPDKRPPVPDKRPPVPDKRPPVPDKRPPVPDKRPPVPDKRPPVPDKRPPVPDKRPPVPDKRPHVPNKRPHVPNKRPYVPNKRPLLTRPDEGYNRYYSHVDSRSFSHDRRNGPSYRGNESGYRWARDNHSTSWQPDYQIMRDGFRRKRFYSSHYSRGRSPHERDSPFFRGSTTGYKNFPHSRYDSNISNKSHSLKRSKTHSYHQSQNRNKKRYTQSLKTSKYTSPSRSSVVPSSKVLDKPSSLPEKEPEKAESKWANKAQEKSDKNNLDEISQFEAGSVTSVFTGQTGQTEEPQSPVFTGQTGQTEEPQSNTTDGTEMYKDNQLSSRCEAITSKVKEIQQVYVQDCETIGMVVKMLIEKDPSLEKSIQFALKQSLHEIGERCIEEVKNFITEYDNSTQDFGDPFKK